MNEEQRLKRNAYMKAYQKKWVAAMSPEKRARYNAQRRANQAAQKLANPVAQLSKAKRFRDKIRNEVLSAYGGACVCCGENEFVFLTIDHIVPIKRHDRLGRDSSYMMCLRLRKEGYPGGYQILCFNCNHAKGTKMECPHKTFVKNRLHGVTA